MFETTKINISAGTVLKVAGFAVTYGLPAARALIRTWTKATITEADWDVMVESWRKSPATYLKEAQEKRK